MYSSYNYFIYEFMFMCFVIYFIVYSSYFNFIYEFMFLLYFFIVFFVSFTFIMYLQCHCFAYVGVNSTFSACVLLCVIDPRVRTIRNQASSCPGIISRTFNVRERTLLAHVQTCFITYDDHKNGHKNRSCLRMFSVMDIIFKRSKAFCALVRK